MLLWKNYNFDNLSYSSARFPSLLDGLSFSLQNTWKLSRWGNFRVFALLFSSRKLPPRENKTHITLWLVSWKLPPREMSCKHFREISPSENNHVYSIVLYDMHDNLWLVDWLICRFVGWVIDLRIVWLNTYYFQRHSQPLDLYTIVLTCCIHYRDLQRGWE